VKRVCEPCSLVRERERDKEREGGERERGREREKKREGEREKRGKERELHARASRNCGHAISVPHSFSQSVRKRGYYINTYCYYDGC
jgi:hypothetical protein